MVTFDAVSAAERLGRERFPEARAAWLGGSAATGSMTPMSDLDITVLLSSKPAPFRESLIVEGRPVELFVHTEDSLWFFCAQDRRRRRPTMLRLIGTSIVIVDVDGAGKRLQDQFHRLDQEGPSALTPEEVEAARYVVTDLLDDLRADGPEVLSVAATLFRETAELVLGANARWSGAGKWLLRELRAFDADQATNHADALSHGLAAVGSGDIAPMQNATNAALTIRPWQLLARSNYVGESQFATDPLFNGRIDSFRVFGRALSAAEIKDLAWTHPALAHRYSFSSNAWDSIGMAHGTLKGNAVITNNALKLTGASGGYVDLPGGLVSGSSAVSIEFWASFGVNGNWARVFDFGNISGANGQNFLFFSPHTSPGGLRLGVSTSGGTVNFDLAGTFDNKSLHVVCLTDPANSYSAIYTNGVLLATTNSPLPALSGVSTAWSFIGRSLFSADAWLSATIDEFRIYDGRLTPEEIAANYQSGPDALALPVTLAQTNNPSTVTLSWPAWAAGFNAEATTGLATEPWPIVTPAPTLAADRWSVSIPKTNAAKFFRLRR